METNWPCASDGSATPAGAWSRPLRHRSPWWGCCWLPANTPHQETSAVQPPSPPSRCLWQFHPGWSGRRTAGIPPASAGHHPPERGGESLPPQEETATRQREAITSKSSTTRFLSFHGQPPFWWETLVSVWDCPVLTPTDADWPSLHPMAPSCPWACVQTMNLTHHCFHVMFV